MKQGQIKQKTTSLRFAANQRGQAVVEYVLLLVVIISMLLAAQGIFSGVKTFISSYIGDYVVCLFDHGELPAQGVADSNMAEHKDQSNCNVKFSIANGATLSGGGATSGSSNRNGSSTNGKDRTSGNQNVSQRERDSKSKSGSNGQNGRSDDSSGGSGGGTSAYANGRINRSNSGRGTADGAEDLSSGKVKVIEEELASDGSSRSGYDSERYRSESRASRYKAIVSGQMYDEVVKNSKREQRKPSTKTISRSTIEEGFRPGPRKNIVVVPDRKPAAVSSDNETSFGFGSMLKWLIIGGMVIALIVFFGGQVMNYSNSD